MNDVEIDHFLASFEDLLHDLGGFLLALGFVDALHFQIGLAMLHDQVDAFLLVDHLKQFDDVLVVDVAEDVDFIFQSGFDVMHEIGMGVFHGG